MVSLNVPISPILSLPPTTSMGLNRIYINADCNDFCVVLPEARLCYSEVGSSLQRSFHQSCILGTKKTQKRRIMIFLITWNNILWACRPHEAEEGQRAKNASTFLSRTLLRKGKEECGTCKGKMEN
jgi:hypothetical protein